MARLKLTDVSILNEHWPVIPKISLDFDENKTLGILTPTSEDMSYFMKVLAGIYEPDAGTITINDININRTADSEFRQIRSKISFVFQRGGLLANLSVLENILLPTEFHFPDCNKEKKIERVHELFDLFEINSKLLKERPFKLQSQMTKLVTLVRSFLLEPEIIVYDKPLLDLDLTRKKNVINHIIKLREQGKTTQIFTESNDILFGIADRNIVIAQGNLIETGTWEDLISSYDVTTQNIIREYLEFGLNETEI